jgi:hypothetical protein
MALNGDQLIACFFISKQQSETLSGNWIIYTEGPQSFPLLRYVRSFYSNMLLRLETLKGVLNLGALNSTRFS